MRQGYVEHFLNPNPKLVKVDKHGHVEPKDLYHERVRIPYRFKEQI